VRALKRIVYGASTLGWMLATALAIYLSFPSMRMNAN
jgi:hypothetical protein